MINIGIIGYGYWGPNLVRNFYAADGCNVVAVADPRSNRMEILKKTYPAIGTFNDAGDVINNSGIDAIIIATPVFTHFELGKRALEAGKHVLIEKPMTATVKESEILIDLAEKKGKLLMVDHTFLYTGAIEKIKELVENKELGNLKYLDSTRINLGLFQPDINVLWDLAPHDLSILNYIVDDSPYSINATGITHTSNGIENIAYLTVNYNSGFIAHFNCSWTSPVKIRMILIGGDKKMILYNDLEPTEKVKVYDTGYDYKTDDQKKQMLVDYRSGDIYVPKVKTHEALLSMATDFIGSIQGGLKPKSSSKIGLDVIKILEAADKSIKNKGCEILIK